MKIVMSVYAKEGMSFKERMRIFRRFFGRNEDFVGHMKWFNNMLGYADVESQPIFKENGKIEEGVELPPKEHYEGYKTPYSVLLGGICFLGKENEICSFVVNYGDIVCPNCKYNYSVLEMLSNFELYLLRVLRGDVSVVISLVDSFELSYVDKLRSHFVTCLAESEWVDTGVAIPRKATGAERALIIDYIKYNFGLKNVTIEQYYCETCAERHPDCPYHVELFVDCSEFSL